MEALSVMDVTAITATGNAAILAQELRASILMSALVRHRICPNHVQTYGVLRTKHAPRCVFFFWSGVCVCRMRPLSVQCAAR